MGISRAFKPGIFPPAITPRPFAMDLHNAMRRGQIQLFYQPQITAQDTLHGLKR